MTDKQKKIISVALELFAKDGFHATSTREIAKTANVSEGLIFRHFINKEGLLKAIISQGEAELVALFAPLFSLEDPRLIIGKIIEIPFHVDQSQYNYWRLIYTLKWQQQAYGEVSINPIMEIAKKAFELLNYEDPQAETEVLEILLDGAATVLLLKEDHLANDRLMKTLKSKYNIHE